MLTTSTASPFFLARALLAATISFLALPLELFARRLRAIRVMGLPDGYGFGSLFFVGLAVLIIAAFGTTGIVYFYSLIQQGNPYSAGGSITMVIALVALFFIALIVGWVALFAMNRIKRAVPG